MSFVSPEQPSGGLSGAARLLRYLPWWLQGPSATDVAAAIGQELDLRDADGLEDQFFIDSASWGLALDLDNGDGTTTRTGWEADYALATIETDSPDVRRARVLGRRQGQAIRTDAQFVALVRSMLLPVATGDPTVYRGYGRWIVYKPFDRGWVTNFADVQATLAHVGPAHIGMYLAPWNDLDGLTGEQIDQLAGYAWDVLTGNEVT